MIGDYAFKAESRGVTLSGSSEGPLALSARFRFA